SNLRRITVSQIYKICETVRLVYRLASNGEVIGFALKNGQLTRRLPGDNTIGSETAHYLSKSSNSTALGNSQLRRLRLLRACPKRWSFGRTGLEAAVATCMALRAKAVDGSRAWLWDTRLPAP